MNNHPIVRDISESLGKLPPYAPDLEEVILGAIILDKNAITTVAGFLKPEHFYSDQHLQIYTSILELFTAGDPIDMRSIVARLRKDGKLEVAGGAFYIAELTSKVNSSANIEYHTRVVIELAMKRDMIQIASQIHQKAYDDTIDSFELKDFAHAQFEGITENFLDTKNKRTAKQVAYEALLNLQNRMAGQTSGIPTGFDTLDRIIYGWHPGTLVILGGRPGMAKTTLAFQSLYFISKEFGIPTGAFSLEMPSVAVVERLACAESEIESDKVRVGKGALSEYEFERISDSYGKIADCDMYLDDSAALHITDIRARAKQMVQKHGIKILLIDYAQLVRGTVQGQAISRDQEIGNVSRGCKAIAKENKICVILISSLNRGLETRGGDKRPQLSDLRESGSLESDADIVMFLYRPEYYKITEDSDGTSTNGLAEVIVAKHRNGALDTARLKFIGKYTKFVPWAAEMRTHTERQNFGVAHYKNPSEQLPSDFKADDNPF